METHSIINNNNQSPISFGKQLNDQLPRIQSIVHEQISFLGDVRDFLKERVALERQYGSSLQAIVKKAMDKQNKRQQALSVGMEPSKPWPGASSTLDSAWLTILTEADEEATNHTNLADSIQTEVCESLKSTEKRKEASRKKHLDYSIKLLADRDKIYTEKLKAKQRYDEACSSVESSRVKQGHAKDEKHLEKASKSMDQSMNEMMSAKNSYLISIAVASEVQKRFYRIDLPRLQDDFQSIWSLTTLKLVSLLKTTGNLNGNFLDSLRAHNDRFLSLASSINSSADQQLFIEYNQRPFSEPQDFPFEPCPIWHDSADFSLAADEPKVLLQNRLGQARAKAREFEPTIDSKRKEISKLESLTEAYGQNESLGDPESVLENLLETVGQTTSLELQYTVLAKEIEVLENALGDDQGSQRPHNFKSSSFVTPTSCCLCNSSIWGLTKQGFTCKSCGIHAHVKCGPKVPANCPGSAPQHSNHNHLSSAMATSPVLNSKQSPFDNQASSSLKRTATNAAPPASRQVNSLSRSTTSVNPNSLNRSNQFPQSRDNNLRAKVIYGYEATNELEVSVSESSIVRVIENDDGSGWIKVESSNGRIGLVPRSYVEVLNTNNGEQKQGPKMSSIAGSSSTPSPTPRVPAVVPPRMKKAKVLYDWEARAPDEHSIKVGETITIAKNGENFGEGWFEIVKDGRKGIVPSNYVELL